VRGWPEPTSQDSGARLSLLVASRAGHGKATPPGARRTEGTILDVQGNAASVKRQMHDWIDDMHMSRIVGRCRIVNVLREHTPEAKQRYGMLEDL
jgi:hypothetical protein